MCILILLVHHIDKISGNNCEAVYIGETSKTVNARKRERQLTVRRNKVNSLSTVNNNDTLLTSTTSVSSSHHKIWVYDAFWKPFILKVTQLLLSGLIVYLINFTKLFPKFESNAQDYLNSMVYLGCVDFLCSYTYILRINLILYKCLTFKEFNL